MAKQLISYVLAGCVTIILGCGTQTVVKTVTVVQPVPVVPHASQVVTRPALLIYAIPVEKKNDPEAVSKAYVGTIEQLIGYSAALQKIVDGYEAQAVQSDINLKKAQDAVNNPDPVTPADK